MRHGHVEGAFAKPVGMLHASWLWQRLRGAALPSACLGYSKMRMNHTTALDDGPGMSGCAKEAACEECSTTRG
eukprot:253334-Pyramimonas_sp.AAC.1